MVISAPDPERLLDKLTRRQRQVLAAWARGERPTAIAARLGISPATARLHLRAARAALPVALPEPPRPPRPLTCSSCRRRPPRSGRRTCARCQAQHSARQAAQQAARAAAGLCRTCGWQPRREGASACAACARLRNLKGTAVRRTRVAAGLCPECGKRPPTRIGNMVCLCGVCAERHRRSHARQRARREADAMRTGALVCGEST